MECQPSVNVKVDQGIIGLALIDSRTGNFVKVNKIFCDIVGLDEAEVEGTSFMEIDHPESVIGHLQHLQSLMAGGVKDIAMEMLFSRDNGSVVLCSLTLFLLWNIGEESEYYMALLEDITVRRSAEAQLKKTNDLLGQRVVELTNELDAKTKELEVTRTLLQEQVHKVG